MVRRKRMRRGEEWMTLCLFGLLSTERESRRRERERETRHDTHPFIFIATYYQTSMRRLRRNVRDDIQRELMSNKLETDIESADWINHFVSRFWLIYEPVLSAQIIGIADAILIENTPSFLDSIRLSTFTLGTKPFRIDGIKTYPRTEPNVVVCIILHETLII